MNTDWGLCGAHGEAAWKLAHKKIMVATGCAPQAVGAFLDSRCGRQFADDVSNALLTTPDMATAIDAAVALWMGWRITRTTEGHYGIPRGLSYLVGFVGSFEVLESD